MKTSLRTMADLNILSSVKRSGSPVHRTCKVSALPKPPFGSPPSKASLGNVPTSNVPWAPQRRRPTTVRKRMTLRNLEPSLGAKAPAPTSMSSRSGLQSSPRSPRSELSLASSPHLFLKYPKLTGLVDHLRPEVSFTDGTESLRGWQVDLESRISDDADDRSIFCC